jgi:hypothetical protein
VSSLPVLIAAAQSRGTFDAHRRRQKAAVDAEGEAGERRGSRRQLLTHERLAAGDGVGADPSDERERGGARVRARAADWDARRDAGAGAVKA